MERVRILREPYDHLILPTGHCFDDALDFLAAVLTDDPTLKPTLMLAHGICMRPELGRFSHAWVEYGEQCIFCGIHNGEAHYWGATRQEYYTDVGVQEVTRYTVSQAIALNKRYNTYGPWIPRYLALCKDTSHQEAIAR